MGHLYLVRHGQASLGEDNYDQLSERGHAQSLRLGQYWRELGVQFDHVICATMQRHHQTLAGIAQGMQQDLSALSWPGLNEYDAEAVIESVHAAPRERPTTASAYRQHFQWLRQGLNQWALGHVQPKGLPTWSEFVHGVTSALDHAHRSDAGHVLVVTSGGPISIALGHVMGLSEHARIELNLQMRNTSISELRKAANGYRVVSFNTLPHLASPLHQDWITYA